MLLPDVALRICWHLPVDEVCALAASSRELSRTATSDAVWRALCQARWRLCWGFAQRWATALAPSPRRPPWREKYRREKADARRSRLTVEELHSLTFDFRFRFDVRRSASRSMRFGPRTWRDNDAHAPWPMPAVAAQGSVSGHPFEDDRITWALTGGGQELTWGIWPHYWPTAQVRRLSSWSWQVSNPNVVMHALDPGCASSCGGDRQWDADLEREALSMMEEDEEEDDDEDEVYDDSLGIL
eukprot:NODE_18679_length_881_cov_9.377984.p1 GENE.NODE_18679_length_881_cov_9.377984~~NODE_18679_length_881_cov_9.377984.p1  ORF type:complete len:249 (-),score=75.04 NODE_18679_length_881_cov_9.377984:133-858(-)